LIDVEIAALVSRSRGNRIFLMITIASRAELEQLLADDVPYGDLTTDALALGPVSGAMVFTARDRMVLALVEDAACIIEWTAAMSSCSRRLDRCLMPVRRS